MIKKIIIGMAVMVISYIGIIQVKNSFGLEVVKAKLVKGDWDLLENTQWCNYPLRIYYKGNDNYLYSIGLNGQGLQRLTDFEISSFSFHRNKDQLLITRADEEKRAGITAQLLLNLSSLKLEDRISAYNVTGGIFWSPDDTQAIYLEKTDNIPNKHERLMLYDMKNKTFEELYDIGLSPSIGVPLKDAIKPPYAYCASLLGWSNDGKAFFLEVIQVDAPDKVICIYYKSLISGKKIVKLREIKTDAFKEKEILIKDLYKTEIYKKPVSVIRYDSVFYLSSKLELLEGTIYIQKGSLYLKNKIGKVECIAKFEGVQEVKLSPGFERPVALPDEQYCITAFFTSFGDRKDNGYYLIDTKTRKIGRMPFIREILFKNSLSWCSELK